MFLKKPWVFWVRSLKTSVSIKIKSKYSIKVFLRIKIKSKYSIKVFLNIFALTVNSAAIWPGGWSFYNLGMGSVSFAYRRFVPFPIYLSLRIPLETTVLVQFGAMRGWRDLGQRRCRPPMSRLRSYFPSWSRRTFGGVNGHACDNHAVVAIINSGSSRDPLSMHLMRRLVLNSISRSPLAMYPVVTTPPLTPSLVLTFRNSAGFIPQPTRILPPSLQLSCRRCSS